MGLREDLVQQMSEAAGRAPFMLDQSVYGVGQPGDDPVQLIKRALQGHTDLIRILTDAVLTLADEVEALR